MKKRLFLLVLALAMILPVFGASTAASNGQGTLATCEVVLLLDSSGSMRTADRDNITTRATKAFASLVPDNATSFKISVVLYNTNVFAIQKSVNVADDAQKAKYDQCMDALFAMPDGGTYRDWKGDAAIGNAFQSAGFSVRSGNTNICAALEEAEKILEQSSAEKKAVLLFTDGKMDTGNKTQDEQLKIKAQEIASDFGVAGTKLYSAALSKGSNSVDRTFMEGLANSTNGKYRLVSSDADLMDLFMDAFAFLTEVKYTGEKVTVSPDRDSVETFEVYDEIVSEVNVSLFSLAEFKSFQVIDPFGKVVAELTQDGKVNINGGCSVDNQGCFTNIKLLNPIGGQWTVSVRSKRQGVMQLGRINMYNLAVTDNDAPTTVSVNGTMELSNLAIYNVDRGMPITGSNIYREAKCTVTVEGNGLTITNPAMLNAAGTGYQASVSFMSAGEYTVTYTIEHEQFVATTVKTVNVLPTELSVTADAQVELGKAMTLTAQWLDPVTHQPVALPSVMNAYATEVKIECDGKVVKEGVLAHTVQNGKFLLNYTPEKAGKYTVTAVMTHYDVPVTTEATCQFTVWQPEVSVSANKTDVTRGETVEFTVGLKNPNTGAAVSVPSYMQGGTVTAIVEQGGTKKTISVDSTMKFSFTPDAAGEYTVKVEFKKGLTTLTTAQALKLNVGTPTISLVTPNENMNMSDGELSVVLNVLNGSGQPMALDVYKDYSVVFTVNGKAAAAVKLSELEATANGAVFTFAPEKAGEQTVSVVVEGGGMKMEGSLKFTVAASEISVDEDEIPQIDETIWGSTLIVEVELDDIFSDSDEDELQFTVKTEGDNITAKIEDGILILEIKGSAEGEVKIIATDGKGAETSASFDVKVTSLLPLLIAIIVIVVLIGIGVPFILLFAKKRRIIRMRYRVKVTVNNEYAVYDVNRASSNRRAKPEMTLKAILSEPTLANYTSGDLSQAAAESAIYAYGDKLTLTGFVFKDGIRIKMGKNKEKVFHKYVVSIPVKFSDEEDSTEVTFALGKTSDFQEDELY